VPTIEFQTEKIVVKDPCLSPGYSAKIFDANLTFESEILDEQLLINHVLWNVEHVLCVHVLEACLQSRVVL